jgi:hypothetical protein
MKKIEQIELDSRRMELVVDMCGMVEKYRKIFDLDMPDIDQKVADKLIVAAMHSALNDIISQLDS